MKKCFIAAALLLLGLSGFAEESFFDNYVYQGWNSFGGLNGTTATDLIQTRDGYINIGTYEGLIRFDGVRFSTLRRMRDNNLKFASVRVVFEDSKNNLWIGSNDEGLHKLSDDGNKIYTSQNGLPNNSVRAICEDNQGNIWIGTAAGVVYLTPQGHLITPQFQAGTIPKGIIAVNLYCDTAGRVWLVSANEKGLFLYSDGLFRTLPELESWGNYFVSAIVQDLRGDFWVGMGDRGLIKIRNGKIIPVKTGLLLDRCSVWAIHVAVNGTMWFGTEHGIFVLNEGKFYKYEKSDLANAKINKIICDREGNIWIATDRNGVGKMMQGKFKVRKLGCTVNAICEDAQNKIWLGTDVGVMCYENDTPVSNALTRYTEGIRIRHVTTDSAGNILVSCYTKPGQLRYNQVSGRIEKWNTDNGLSGNKVRVALETEPGEIYVGTTTGISIIHKDGSIKNFKQIDGLENEYVMCIFRDRNDVVWIGTDGNGIYLMKKEVIFAHITSDDGLSGNVIFKITQDRDGVYWICTGNGITRCTPFDSAHGLPTYYFNINSEQGIGTDSVFQLINGADRNLWITSNYGIATIKKEEMTELASGLRDSINVKYFNKNDGLDSDGATSTAVSICDSYGRLWFSMIDGFAVYDPVSVTKNPVKPLVQIETVVIDNVEYRNNNQEFVLQPGTKRVEIKFTGLSFDAPDRIRFTHQLTDFEDEMSEPTFNRSVSYTNIKPGKHTFLLTAINGDGLASEQVAAMLFVQRPYFYQRPMFWIMSVLIFLAVVFIIFSLKQRAIRLENIRLEETVRRRTKELAAEKDKSEQLLRAILPDKIADELKDEIHSIGENFEEVTLLFSDIVNFTNTSSGYTAAEIVDALNDLFSRFDERAKRTGVEKIKTIGDAYMAACGIPVPNSRHAQIMVDFARGMFEDLAEYNKTAKIHFEMRIGLNTGPVTAGVIGKTKFIYDVWGDTVNIASRMETASTPGKIRVSEAVWKKLNGNGVNFTAPIECNIKGKGIMTTYEVV